MTTENITTAPAKPRRTGRAQAATVTLEQTPATARAPLPPPASKADTVIKLLLRTKGATAVELIAATGWQPHSVRAFLSGLRKKGRVIVREARKSGEFAYRIVTTPSVEETVVAPAVITALDNLTEPLSVVDTVATGEEA